MKRLLLMLAATVMTLSAGASIRDTKTVAGYVSDGTYEYEILRDNETQVYTAEVSRSGNGYSGDVVIPEHIYASAYTDAAIPVEGIGSGAFSFMYDITSFTLPNTIRYFGYQSFANVRQPEKFNWPSSLEEIAGNAFSGWNWLEELSGLPESLRSVAGFAGLESLRKVVLPEGVVEIGPNAFNICPSLTEVQLPESIERIGDMAFYGCSNLATVNLPHNLESIGMLAFAQCGSLTEAVLPASLKSIGVRAWWNCSAMASFEVEEGNPEFLAEGGVLFGKGLGELLIYPVARLAESYTVPDGVVKIGYAAFCGAANLKSITLSNTVETIDDVAFERCVALESLTLSTSLKEIGSDVFGYDNFACPLATLHLPASLSDIRSWPSNPGFASITVDGGNLNFTSVDGVLFDKAVRELICYPSGYPASDYEVPAGVTDVTINVAVNLRSLILPEGVKNISLRQNNELVSVNIPSTAVSVDITRAKSLRSLSLPDNVSTINLQENEALETVNIPAGVRRLETECFRLCPSLTDIIIPATVKEFGQALFFNSQLDKLVIEGNYDSYEWMGILPEWMGVAPAHQVPEGCVVYAHEEEFDAIRQYWTGELRPIGEFDSIEGVEAVADGPVRYFDLHGRSVASPSAGGIYVRTGGGERRVVRF